MSNKRYFKVTVKNEAGEASELSLYVAKPDSKAQSEAQKAHNKAFREAIENKAIVRQRIDAIMREQNLWDDEKQTTFESLRAAIMQGERTLAKGGIKKSEAKAVALKMRKDRGELQRMLAERNQLDAYSAEAQAENARFNSLVSSCTFSEDDKKYFKDMDDYLNRAGEDAAVEAAKLLANIIYGLDDDFLSKFPENIFLIKHKFMDDKCRLINSDGHLIDDEGRLINSKGQLVNSKDELVDVEGNLITDDGKYKVDFQPFLEDEEVETVLV